MRQISYIILVVLICSAQINGQNVNLSISSNLSFDLYFISQNEYLKAEKLFAPSFETGLSGYAKIKGNYNFDFGIKYFLFRRKYITNQINLSSGNIQYRNKTNEKLFYATLPIGINISLNKRNFKVGIQPLLLIKSKRKRHLFEINETGEETLLPESSTSRRDVKYKMFKFEGYIGGSRFISKSTELDFKIFWRISDSKNDSYVTMPNFRFAFGINQYIN